MFDLLQHPPRSPEPVPVGTGISLAVHAALVLSLLTGAEQSLTPTQPTTAQSIIESALRYLLPPDRAGAPSDEVKVKWSSKQAGTTGPADPSVWAEQRPEPVGTRSPDKEDGAVPQPLEEAAAAQHAFTLLDVDTAAVRDPASAVPVYPRLLEKQGIEGVAVVRFVVDSTGRADLATFTIVETNHPLFGAAVREALPGMKFHPATVGPTKVRQMVELPFGFQIIRRGAPDGSKKPND